MHVEVRISPRLRLFVARQRIVILFSAMLHNVGGRFRNEHRISRGISWSYAIVAGPVFCRNRTCSGNDLE
jgi:hypothetical protein